MSHNVARTPNLGNQMLGMAMIAGPVGSALMMGLAGGVGRLVARIGRRRLASDAGRRCQEAEQFVYEMSGALEQLAEDLDAVYPGMTDTLFSGLVGLRERNMWFLEEDYRAFVLEHRRVTPTEIRQTLGQWVVEPLRRGLDATRKAVGRQLHDERHSAIRRRLNERIRVTENELVESASRLLHADVARPGECARGRRRRLGMFLRRLVLGVLAVSALLVVCAHSWGPAGRAQARTPPAYLSEPSDCSEWEECDLSKTRHAALTSQRGSPDARGDRRRDRPRQSTRQSRAGSRGAV